MRWMLRLRDGDEEALAHLLARHRNGVVRFLHRMVQDHAQAEELAQEVFLRIYRSRKQYRPEAKFTSWLYRIAANLALNALRDGRWEKKNRVGLDQAGGEADCRLLYAGAKAEQNMLLRERVEEIRAAVGELPARQRAAVLMHKYAEMDYAGIAAALGCSEAAVKSLLFRAYETLRARLAHLVYAAIGPVDLEAVKGTEL